MAWVVAVFDARIASGTVDVGDDETAEVRWATTDDAVELVTTPPWRHILSSVRDGRAY